MEFIPVEELMKAGKEVNDLVRKWWEPSYGDIFTELLNEGFKRTACILCNENLDKTNNGGNNIYLLLTTQQLIDFIEWRTDYKLEKIETCVDEYWIVPHFESSGHMDEEMPRWYREEISFNDKSLIKALWKCACEVARDSYYD